VTNTFVAGQDALGIDYNGDGKGIGFNVPSLLGLHAVPPYLHNGAAESLAAVLASAPHRTDNGRLTDMLTNAVDQAKVVAFLESIDVHTVPFVTLAIQQNSPYVTVSFDSIANVQYAIEARDTITGFAWTVATVTGNGQRMDVSLPDASATRFYRLVAGP